MVSDSEMLSQQRAEREAARFRALVADLRREVGRVIVGMEEVVDNTLIALLSGGHVLLEGVPGLGKTLLVRTLADALDLRFSRIQFTPDLMPADITGTTVLWDSPTGAREFVFQAGPVFANVVLADEINRATPKTQSALLEAMQEHSVTVGGQTHILEEPFLVFATQNPIEMEGTYPLPEAQLDRFLFKVRVSFPSLAELHEIMNRTTGVEVPRAEKVAARQEILELSAVAREVPVAEHVQEFALRLLLATHPEEEGAPDSVRRFVRYGASPRGAQALVASGKVRALMDERFNVAEQDIKASALVALRHRIGLNFEGQAEDVDTDDLIAEAIETVEGRARRDVPV
ncbi:MAG TPA: AAA family ATPase [Armatimonadota bacterium]|nr:AAA family ATPase [Armatimonadota bacterium]